MRGRARSEQVPAVPGDVEKHRDLTKGFLARLGDELDAGVAHASVCGLEVLDAQEQPDATGELVTNCSLLTLAVGSGEEQRGRGAGRPHHDPALLPSIVGQRRRVLGEFKAEDADEESDRRVVVLDDQGNLLDVHPRHSASVLPDHAC